MHNRSFVSESFKTPHYIVINSIFVALFLCVKAVNVYMSPNFVEDEIEGTGIMTRLYILSIGVLGICSLIYFRKLYRTINGWHFNNLIFILFLYIITKFFFFNAPYTSFKHFLVFTIISFLIPSTTVVDSKILLKTAMFLSVPAIFNLRVVFYLIYNIYISMGTSYAFLTPVVMSIIYMFIFYKKESLIQKRLTIILFTINIIYAFQLLAFGSRGPVFALILLIVFLYVFPPPEKKRGARFVKVRFFNVLFVTIIVVTSFISILHFLRSFLGNYAIRFNFIEKILKLNENNYIANGRDNIYDLAFSGFFESPIWGHGFDLFMQNTGFAYPHNFILQILYDGGIIMFFILLIPISLKIINIYRTCTRNEYALYTTLLFISVPGAMFSGDLWKSASLWFLFGAILSRDYVRVNNLKKSLYGIKSR